MPTLFAVDVTSGSGEKHWGANWRTSISRRRIAADSGMIGTGATRVVLRKAAQKASCCFSDMPSM